MDEHFAELFSRYEALAPERVVRLPVAQIAVGADSAAGPALTPSAVLGS
jgi:hypothetical protein